MAKRADVLASLDENSSVAESELQESAARPQVDFSPSFLAGQAVGAGLGEVRLVVDRDGSGDHAGPREPGGLL